MTAPTATTHGVTIEVHTQFEARFSLKQPDPRYIFSYRIQIVNNSEFTLQLMRRHWNITDGFYGRQIVEGDGVIGQQPILEPGESYVYTSACHLRAAIGRMVGWYEMERHRDGAIVRVQIPEFVLSAPNLLN